MLVGFFPVGYLEFVANTISDVAVRRLQSAS